MKTDAELDELLKFHGAGDSIPGSVMVRGVCAGCGDRMRVHPGSLFWNEDGPRKGLPWRRYCTSCNEPLNANEGLCLRQRQALHRYTS